MDYLGYRTAQQAGFTILRSATRPEWLRAPACSFAELHHMFHADGERGARALDWHTDTPAPHTYDKHKAYLGACTGTMLGVGEPRYYPAPRFVNWPGVWRITVTGPSNYPDLFPRPWEEQVWQYTPILRVLVAMGYPFEIHEAYLFSEQHVVLRGFYESVREHLAQVADPAGVQALKDIYTRTLGSLAHLPTKDYGSELLYRPDWWHMLVAAAQERMFQQMLAVYTREGLTPQGIETDKLLYAEPVQTLPMGAGIGQYSYKYQPA